MPATITDTEELNIVQGDEVGPDDIIIGPNSEPQTRFIASEADITIYGGAAGGGKTFGMLLDPLQHIDVKGFRAVYFRRTSEEMDKPGGLWDESMGIYTGIPGAKPNQTKMRWKFPAGSRIDFDHLQYDSTCHNWKSSQLGAMYFDQLEMFTEFQWWYMFTRNRSVCGVKPFIKATVNPDPDSWVRKFLSWWIDDATGYVIPERNGKTRWFIKIHDEVIWADTKEGLLEYEGVGEHDPKSVCFIKADVYDNVDLMAADPAYEGNLKAADYVQRMRLLGGNWNVRYTAGTVFRKSMFRICYSIPRMISIGRAWDLAATKHEGNNDPDWACGFLVGMDEHHRIFLLERERLRESSLMVELAIKGTAHRDTPEVPIRIEQEGGASGKGWPESIIRNHLQGFIATYLPPPSDKLSRAKPLASQAEIGNVYLYNPGGQGSYCRWIEEFLTEAENFPPLKKKDGHDDQIDAAVAAYELCLENMGLTQWEPSQGDGKYRIGGREVPDGVFMGGDSQDRHRSVMEELHGRGDYGYGPDESSSY